MLDTDRLNHRNEFTAKVIEAAVKLAVLALLVGWCLSILSPFLIIIAWGLIIAISVFPIYQYLLRKSKGRRKLSAAIVVLGLLAVIFIPTGFITESMVKNIEIVELHLHHGEFVLPQPNENIKEWPLVGDQIYSFWSYSATHIKETLLQIAPHLKKAGLWLFENLGKAGFGFLEFLLSIVLCGVMLVYSGKGRSTADDIGTGLIGIRGKEFVDDTIITIRNVGRGILGVSFLQAVLFGVALVLAGIPFAGILSLICLMLAIIQLGIGLVTIPVIIYSFITLDLWVAILLTIWLMFISLIDNVLKPIIMGRKAPVPTIVIFMGAIGGFMLNGIIGLFVGAVVLSLGFKMLTWWMDIQKNQELS